MTVSRDESLWPPSGPEGEDTSVRPKEREAENYQHDPSGTNEDNETPPDPEDQKPEGLKKAQQEMQDAAEASEAEEKSAKKK